MVKKAGWQKLLMIMAVGSDGWLVALHQWSEWVGSPEAERLKQESGQTSSPPIDGLLLGSPYLLIFHNIPQIVSSP